MEDRRLENTNERRGTLYLKFLIFRCLVGSNHLKEIPTGSLVVKLATKLWTERVHIGQSPLHRAEVLKFADEGNDKALYDVMNSS